MRIGKQIIVYVIIVINMTMVNSGRYEDNQQCQKTLCIW